MHLQVTLLMSLVLVSGCGEINTSPPKTDSIIIPQPSVKKVLDVPNLIGKSPSEFEKIVGPSVRVTKITNDPDMMPGEYRDYKIADTLGSMTKDGLWVRFYKGVAHHITFDLPTLADTPEDALLMAGIDVKGMAPRVKAPIADRWTGNFNGVDFKDVAALKLDSAMKKYSTVQAELAQ